MDEVSDVAQPSINSGIGKHNTKSDSEKIKLAKGIKKEEKSKKKSKKLRKKFQTSSSSSESSSSTSSMADEDKKRSSRASKLKAKKKFVMVDDDDDDDDDDDHKSSELEEDVPQILNDSQPITYTTKPDKESFLTQVALKRELGLSFEHGYMVIDYQLKTFKMNLCFRKDTKR